MYSLLCEIDNKWYNIQNSQSKYYEYNCIVSFVFCDQVIDVLCTNESSKERQETKPTDLSNAQVVVCEHLDDRREWDKEVVEPTSCSGHLRIHIERK